MLSYYIISIDQLMIIGHLCAVLLVMRYSVTHESADCK